MKNLFVVCFLGLISLTLAEPILYPRGCIYIMGSCSQGCPEGTHGYAIGCDYVIPEATCEEPNPVQHEYMSCDYSACYCDPPTVRDTKSDRCVPLDQCPNKQA